MGGLLGKPVIITSKKRTQYLPVSWAGTVTEVTETSITVIPLDVDNWFPNDPEVVSISLTFDLTLVNVEKILGGGG